jgi:hypothetical protein
MTVVGVAQMVERSVRAERSEVQILSPNLSLIGENGTHYLRYA